MSIEINGLHILAAIVSIFVWAFILPFWPSLFIFVIGQIASTFITRIFYDLNIGD